LDTQIFCLLCCVPYCITALEDAHNYNRSDFKKRSIMSVRRRENYHHDTCIKMHLMLYQVLLFSLISIYFIRGNNAMENEHPLFMRYFQRKTKNSSTYSPSKDNCPIDSSASNSVIPSYTPSRPIEIQIPATHERVAISPTFDSLSSVSPFSSPQNKRFSADSLNGSYVWVPGFDETNRWPTAFPWREHLNRSLLRTRTISL
jgi:hypothetical protein